MENLRLGVSKPFFLPIFFGLSLFACGENEGKEYGFASSDAEKAESKGAETRPEGCPLYPLVFQHGFMGGSKLGFFKGASEILKAKGCLAFDAEVDAIQSVESRGQQLADQIKSILSTSGAEKVNIVAHSQGGLDARFAISGLDLGASVASLSTLGTPHQGTPIADLALDIREDSPELMKRTTDALLKLMVGFVGERGASIDTEAALRSLSTDYLKLVFNVDMIDDPSVYYQSWAGQSGKGTQDQIKLNLLPTQLYLQNKSGANDGMVAVESAKWGDFRGVLDADHLDLVGLQMGDLRSPFKLEPFIEQLAKELAAKGY